MTQYNPTGVMLVGSVPLQSTEAVLTKVCGTLSGRLHAIPDGETGERCSYISWQIQRFPPAARQLCFGGTTYDETERPTFTLEDIAPTGYDDAAIASYAKFVALREKGVVPPDVRFQVGLPTCFGPVMFSCKPEFRVEIDPLYLKRLQQSLDRIVNNIPHQDLVIQFDLAPEMLSLEAEVGRLENSFIDLYFKDSKAFQPGIIERLVSMCEHIPPTVNIALHLCYGDMDHKHLIEPVDTRMMVNYANGIMGELCKTHKMEWIHIPVPKDRNDPGYFEPLKDLCLNDTRLYLGLIHANDEEGTRERIKTANSICPHPFGVATECGWGRTPKDDIDSILSISKHVSAPVKT